MPSLLQQTHEILRFDLNPDFVETLAIEVAWRYDRLYEELRDDDALPLELKLTEFAARRANCAIRAMVLAAQQHGVPYSFRSLECNGQQKILLKMGRIVLIQEPFLELSDAPRIADYKRELAETHGLIRQLELNLGDVPNRDLDWSGSILAVLLHGASGPRFTRRDRALGGLMLAVPDGDYATWVARLDLYRIAMLGLEKARFSTDGDPGATPSSDQKDEVVVRLKKKQQARVYR
ncbi:hypothetical protein MPL1032_310025 [Mesorhizobium plurifarium]|uniref:Uncharacterized protein n=1 Tax=Mesorhizobium plurifarium TaxID=69974 RepID=A0A0K2W411_MESPL|nr:hypothetical protein MPL1032_310025 [Mesorhizobium plurifarium]